MAHARAIPARRDARLLRAGLRILGLVRGRIGHRKREPVNQLDVPILPEPGSFGALLDFRGNLGREIMHRGLRQLRASPAIIARVVRGDGAALLVLMGDDPRHGRLAGSLFAIPQHLAQKGPHHDDRRIHAVQAEQVAMPGEDPLNPLG